MWQERLTPAQHGAILSQLLDRGIDWAGTKTDKNAYTAVTKQDDDWWIGWIEEVPGVNCQERTHAELLASLRETLREALKFNRQDAIGAAVANYTEELVTV